MRNLDSKIREKIAEILQFVGYVPVPNISKEEQVVEEYLWQEYELNKLFRKTRIEIRKGFLKDLPGDVKERFDLAMEHWQGEMIVNFFALDDMLELLKEKND